jgi:uncharacterized protein YheU (UPF0270 family)
VVDFRNDTARHLNTEVAELKRQLKLSRAAIIWRARAAPEALKLRCARLP